MDRARAETEAMARSAAQALDPLPDGEVKSALQALAILVVRRET